MADQIGGVILAAGRSSRMGGVDKGSVLLAGKTLLQRVTERVSLQVDCLAINTVQKELTHAYQYPLIRDRVEGFHGPLMGVWSAFMHPALRDISRLAVVPCDGPFVPENLVATLNQAMRVVDADVALVSYQGQWQPTFSLWHQRTTGPLKEALDSEKGIGLKGMMRELKIQVVDWPLASIPPFYNINNPDDLAHAESLLCL